MKTLLIQRYNGYLAKHKNDLLLTNEFGVQSFWDFVIKSIKTFGFVEIDFYSVESPKNFKKYTKTDIKRSLHTQLTKGVFSKTETLLLIDYFGFPKEKYLSEQMTLKFPKAKPTGRAWQKEHYNIDHSNKKEVAYKRKKAPARNARKKTTTKKKK
jgi:hypothetical protein